MSVSTSWLVLRDRLFIIIFCPVSSKISLLISSSIETNLACESSDISLLKGFSHFGQSGKSKSKPIVGCTLGVI